MTREIRYALMTSESRYTFRDIVFACMNNSR